jgi:hypothetical protein
MHGLPFLYSTDGKRLDNADSLASASKYEYCVLSDPVGSSAGTANAAVQKAYRLYS